MSKKTNNKIPAKGIEWDLSDLYSGMNDTKIEKDKKDTEKLTASFIKNYKEKINSKNLTSEFLFRAITDYEKIYEKLYIYTVFASLLHSKNTISPDIGKFYQQAEEFFNKIHSQLLWFNLEWTNLDDSMANKILKDKKLENYKHHLAHLRIFKPYRLGEKEEEILSKKSQTSSNAFVRLYDEIDSSCKFKIKINGKEKELSYSELSPYLTIHPDRNIREQASESLTEGLKKQEKLYTYILNTLLLDKKVNDEIRRYKYPQQSTFLSYEIDPEAVKSMVEAIEKSHRISEKFYTAKKKLLGYKKLYEWDRYSPTFSEGNKEYSWEEAKNLVLESFQEFSPKFREIAEIFFDKKWIDAEISEGKRAGAFCSYNAPSKHPYVLVNFSGKIRDVTTIAHELGHAIHGYLSKNNPLLEAWPSTAAAEIASVFAESLVFDKIYNEEKDKKVKINLLTEKIQNSFATVFRQTSFYLFESDIHKARREKGELKTEDFNSLFQSRLQKMFGKGLDLTDGHQYWWMPIMHFYHYNFYVFSYAFGEMLTLSLYAKYKKQGKVFVDDYTNALSLGGSKTPLELTRIMGIDINQKNFWINGLKLLENYVDEFIKLSK